MENNENLNNQVNASSIGKQVQSNNNSKIIITIMALIIFGLVGYIVYTKLIQKNENPEPKPTDTSTVTPVPNNTQESTLPEWATYILNQKVTSIKYGYADYYDSVSADFKCAEKDVTKEQLKLIFEKMTESKLKKHDAGGAGSDCNNEGLTIEYGNNKKLHIFQNRWITIDSNLDSELMNLIEKDVDIREEVISSDPWLVYEYEWDASYVVSLLK